MIHGEFFCAKVSLSCSRKQMFFERRFAVYFNELVDRRLKKNSLLLISNQISLYHLRHVKITCLWPIQCTVSRLLHDEEFTINLYSVLSSLSAAFFLPFLSEVPTWMFFLLLLHLYQIKCTVVSSELPSDWANLKYDNIAP